ncbi:hypothetical protein JCM4914_05980 [Streptomyces platensis subsp. malvinus]
MRFTTFTGIVRTMTPELPDDPDAEQVRAWVELAELSLDPDFRAAVRRMLAAVNGWPAPDGLAPVLDWSVRALRLRSSRR